MTTRTVSELADLCGARLEGDGSALVVGPAALQEARPDQVSFLGHPKYKDLVLATRAGAVLVDLEFACERSDLPLLRCEDPSRSFTEVVRSFAESDGEFAPGIHPTAVVAEGAEIAPDVYIGPHCTIGSGAVIQSGSVLVAHVSVGLRAKIGKDCVLHPFVVLYPRIILGERVIVHGGSVLGADGFGFEPTASGWVKIPQCGTVHVEDDVEIGANSTIDRGRFGATRIGRGTKIDNLVHVAHNVQIEPGALLVAQAGVAGSARIGKGAILAGQAGISGHVEVGAGARVGGNSGVFKDVPPGADFFGSPAGPLRESAKVTAYQKRLGQLFGQVKELERRLRELEKGE